MQKIVVPSILPFSYINNNEHEKLFKVLDASTVLPTKTIVQRQVMSLFETEKILVQSLIFRASERLNLTTDVWSSVGNKVYLSITTH